MSTSSRGSVAVLLLALISWGSIELLHAGVYGLTIFVVAPTLFGGIVAWGVRPSSAGRAMKLGAIAGIVAPCALLLVKVEGLLCIVMAAPLTASLGILGAWLMYQVSQYPARLRSPGSVALLLLLPASLTWDTQARPPVFAVRTAVTIAASPEEVWKHVVTFSDLPEPQEWYFRSGLAYPIRARIEGSGPGAVRYCEFSTGPFVEPIDVWDEPRLLRFRGTQNPAPMHEWSPYADLTPKHLHGYLVSKRGQFLLTKLPGNRTLLEGTTWYQHGLWPAQYWRWWSDAIIHRIHLRVLNHIKLLTEAKPPEAL